MIFKRVLHPLYDRYSEHIELIGDVLYRGKTDKGIITIETFHLRSQDLLKTRDARISGRAERGMSDQRSSLATSYLRRCPRY